MEYQETKPDKALITHVESFWEISSYDHSERFVKVLAVPEAVFDILFVNTPVFICNPKNGNCTSLFPGAYFVGLFTESKIYILPEETSIFGIRLKPFSLSNIAETPLCKFSHSVVSLGSVFKQIDRKNMNAILHEQGFREKIGHAGRFVTKLVEEQQDIDKALRDQLNFMMDSFGNIRISSLYSDFYTNKTSLRSHFLCKVGLLPKELAKIWRMNYFLKLRLENSSDNLTAIGLDAGYFDQSHLIRDFRTFFAASPLQFFNRQQSADLKEIQERIKRRLTSYYSPR